MNVNLTGKESAKSETDTPVTANQAENRPIDRCISISNLFADRELPVVSSTLDSTDH